MVFKCMCCDQIITKMGNHVTLENAAKHYDILLSLGYTRFDLLTKYRPNLEFTLPGLIEWITEHHPEETNR